MNIRALIAIGGVLLLGGCANASADEEHSFFWVADDIEVKSGYYLADSGDSYICVEDGEIELCNFDFYEFARTKFDISPDDFETPEAYEEQIRGTAEVNALDRSERSDFVVVEFCEEINVDGKPFIMLVTNTTREEVENEELQAPRGFVLEDENTLFVGSRFPKYIYAGEELPE